MERESLNDGSKTKKERAANVRKASRVADEEKNPCLHEQELSYKCLSANDYDRDKCATSFQNYKNCQIFWTEVSRERKRNGVRPALPPLEERDSIRREKLIWATNS